MLKDEEHYKWNKNSFGPVDGGAGCYVEIEVENNKILVHTACKC